MNRRDAFKAIVAGAAALLGLKGLAETEGPWFVGTAVRLDRPIQSAGARTIAAKIDGRWVDTSDWTPEQFKAIRLDTMKLSPGTGREMVALPALGPGPHTLEVGYSEAG